ncbi:MAG: hypothetical protein BWY82_01845 [Verrucomicrobia bacterium ADurb.Bin474]|nr:MAG: hypothetical protein BWY82_01845 [Verrucomicrobia bacterium ADurb.Bin474]
MSGLQRTDKPIKRGTTDPTHRLQTRHPLVPLFRIPGFHRLIRTIGRIDSGSQRAILQFPMPTQIIHWIIGCAHNLHLEMSKQSLGRKTRIRHPLGRNLPNAFRIYLVDNEVAVENTLQLEMTPMIHRIPDRVGHGPGERHKFLFWRGVSSAKALRNTVGPHQTPFVMVALQPDLVEV